MTYAASLRQGYPIEGVYLCDALDLPEIFGTALAAETDLRLYLPADVPDPTRIRFALAWRPAANAFAPYPNLRLVQVIAAGVDPVLSARDLPPQVTVARVHDAEQAATMAGFAAWQVVWHHRQKGKYLTAAAKGEWTRDAVKTLRPPSQVPVGVLGYGLMGRAIARAVAAMGFPVLAASRTKGPADPGVTRLTGAASIQRVASQAAILINVLPLTQATRDILAAPLFAQMPQGAALIQLGRGEHMIEEDLLDALDSDHLSGASLDVFRTEPLPRDHPFWHHPKITLTPHEASVTSVPAVAKALVKSLSELAQGRTLTTAVDIENGY